MYHLALAELGKTIRGSVAKPNCPEDPEMEIRRDTAGYNSHTDPKPPSPSRGIIETERARTLIQQNPSDRRRQPDRRLPKLLGRRGARPEPVDDRRGKFVDVRV